MTGAGMGRVAKATLAWGALLAVLVSTTTSCSTQRPPSQVTQMTQVTSPPAAKVTRAPSPTASPLPSTPPNAVSRGRAGGPRGGTVGDVDDASPDAVARAVAVTTFVYDTRLDRSAQDASRRAVRWMTPEAASRAEATTAGSGAWWSALAADDGWTTATAQPDTEPPPATEGGRTFRRLFVTVTPASSATSPAPASPLPPVQRWVVVVALSHDPSLPTRGWRATEVLARPVASS